MKDKYDWYKMVHENTGDFDCQVVSAVNAYHYLTGKLINPKSKRYKNLVSTTGCKYVGDDIDIDKVHDKLGICFGKHMENGWHPIVENRGLLPVEVTVWHKTFHIYKHSILIVDIDERTRCYRVTNFHNVASTGGWIFEEDLRLHLPRLMAAPFRAIKLNK